MEKKASKKKPEKAKENKERAEKKTKKAESKPEGKPAKKQGTKSKEQKAKRAEAKPKEEKASKTEAKAKKEKAKAGPSQKKKKEKKKPEKISKPKNVKKLSKLVLGKKRHMFRGRFGKRSVRNVADKKWQKWRRPRGIDIYFKKEDGLVPGTGYRTAKKIRFVHPSGYRERLVKNMQDLVALEKKRDSVAARISAKIGKRKKKEMVKKASELKIVVLNR